jgi:DNA topoisomerase-3
MMKLVLTDRGRVADAIASALGPPRFNRKLWIECGSTFITWCGARALVDLEPEEYDSRWKSWSLEQLPMIPEQWRIKPTETRQLKAIQSLLDRATSVVHAGSCDSVGQFIIDEILAYLAYPGEVLRAQLTDLTPAAIVRSLESAVPNERFAGLTNEVRARRRVDWLVGHNLTRFATLRGRDTGVARPNDVLSAGRVRTPCLQLIVRRDLEISAARQTTNYAVGAEFEVAVEQPAARGKAKSTYLGTLRGMWIPRPPEGEEHSAADVGPSEGRLASAEDASRLAATLRCQRALLLSVHANDIAEPLPSLFTLPTLQTEAFRHFGLSAKETLDAAQNLFEIHSAISFPGCDSDVWPSARPGENACERAAAVLEAIRHTCPSLEAAIAHADPRSAEPAPTPEDGPPRLHHGIVPTVAPVDPKTLTREESLIYSLIAARFVARFVAPPIATTVVAIIAVGSHRFRCVGREVAANSPGWQELALSASSEGEETAGLLKALQPGCSFAVRDVRVSSRPAQPPPRRYNDGSLVGAMNRISDHVVDSNLRAVLAASTGGKPIRLGTPITQAEIIEDLCRRELVVRTQEGLVSTPLGRRVLDLVPPSLASADVASVWELALDRVARQELPVHQFVDGVAEQLGRVFTSEAGAGPAQLSVIPAVAGDLCPACRKGSIRRRTSKFGVFLGCSTYPQCRYATSSKAPVRRQSEA